MIALGNHQMVVMAVTMVRGALKGPQKLQRKKRKKRRSNSEDTIGRTTDLQAIIMKGEFQKTQQHLPVGLKHLAKFSKEQLHTVGTMKYKNQEGKLVGKEAKYTDYFQLSLCIADCMHDVLHGIFDHSVLHPDFLKLGYVAYDLNCPRQKALLAVWETFMTLALEIMFYSLTASLNGLHH